MLRQAAGGEIDGVGLTRSLAATGPTLGDRPMWRPALYAPRSSALLIYARHQADAAE
jgi:hypothetical protein